MLTYFNMPNGFARLVITNGCPVKLVGTIRDKEDNLGKQIRIFYPTLYSVPIAPAFFIVTGFSAYLLVSSAISLAPSGAPYSVLIYLRDSSHASCSYLPRCVRCGKSGLAVSFTLLPYPDPGGDPLGPAVLPLAAHFTGALAETL